MTVLAGTQHQPHARLSLESALGDDAALSHAYLFYGPSGSGKRAAACAFAAELISRDETDPEEARARVESKVHPDLAWVEPRGAHEILVDDVRTQIVGQAMLRPFESSRRVFVIVDAERMNDESQNALLKTLEEPAEFAVFILVSSAPGRLLPTIPSRCRSVRFGSLPVSHVADKLVESGVEAALASACARLAGSDEQLARALAGPLSDQRGEAEAALQAALSESDDARWRVEAAWAPLLDRAEAAGQKAHGETKAALDELLEQQPKRGRSGTKTEFDRQARRSRRRAHTASLDLSLRLVELWLRDMIAVAVGAEGQVFNLDRLAQLRHDAEGRDIAPLIVALGAVEETRRHLERNVTEDLAIEALFDRLRRRLG